LNVSAIFGVSVAVVRSRAVLSLALWAIASAQAMLAAAAHAQTRAGTIVTNVATMQVRDSNGATSLSSNPAALLIAERLDVALARSDDTRIDTGSGGVAVAVVLTNRGNGGEAFDVVASLSDATAKVRLIAIDTDNNGRFDPASDTALANGRTPVLDPAALLRLLVVLDPAAADATAALTLDARAVTGSGPSGTVFAGQGEGGGDAVTGANGAHATLVVPIGGAAGAGPVLVKTQSVRAPDGSDRPLNGAIITYRLEARFAGPAAAVRIDDPVPQGTAYVPGSLTLDAARLSDARDDDVGSADPAGIAVTLGDIPGAAVRVVQFQVKIL
jgi:uncharacterized repeat protein (TIGR01451 family)